MLGYRLGYPLGNGGLGLVLGGSSDWQAILGSPLVLEYDARYGARAGAWIDRRRALQVTSPGTSTVYAADGSNFNGLPVQQTAFSPSAVLRAPSPVPPVLLSGNRAYSFSVLRIRSFPAGNAFPGMRLTNAALSAEACSLLATSGTTLTGIVGDVGAAVLNTSTVVSSYELFVNASNNVVLAINGITVATIVGGGALATNTGDLSFGGLPIGTLSCSSSHALHLVCNALPTTEHRAALLARAKLIWGF